MKKHKYPAHQIQAVIDRMAIAEVIGRFIDLRRCGANLVGLCCFHEDRTPSLYVSIAKGIFKCFPCGVGGNAVHFIMEHEGLSWIEAVKWIADFYGLPMEEIPASPEEEARAAARKEAIGKLSEACIGYQSLLPATPAVMHYLGKERGLSAEIIEQFQLGYGGEKDYFRGRVVFPVHDKQGKCVGFGGRVLPASVSASSGDDSYVPVVPVNPDAKYLNSSESDIYKKSNLLYGLHLAKGAITRKKVGYLVEGYTDVLMMHQAGYTHCVGTCGTALTVEQVRLLKPYTKKMVVLFDGDKAGQKAAVRAIDILLEGDMVVDVVRLPKGVDPAEYLSAAPVSESGTTSIESLDTLREDFVSYILGCVPEGADVPMRVAGQKRVVQAIAKIKDKLYRQGYVEELCAHTGLKVDDVLAEVDGLVKSHRASGASTSRASLGSVSETSADANKPCTISYSGAYPIVLDIPVNKEWHDYWNALDRKMRYVGNTVKEVVALETDIVCTVLLDGIMCESTILTIPVLKIDALHRIIRHIAYQEDLSVSEIELMMNIQAKLAVYSQTGQVDCSGDTDGALRLQEVVANYCKCGDRMQNMERLLEMKGQMGIMSPIFRTTC